MSTFHTTTGYYLNDTTIEGAGSVFVTKNPMNVVFTDVGSPGKFTICVSQKNGVSPATGHIRYNGGERKPYSVPRTGVICAGSHGIPDSKAFPSLDGGVGILIEPDQPLTFFKQFTKA